MNTRIGRVQKLHTLFKSQNSCFGEQVIMTSTKTNNKPAKKRMSQVSVYLPGISARYSTDEGSKIVRRKPIANSTASPLESLVKPVNSPPPCTCTDRSITNQFPIHLLIR
jgi:hypothetical protein